MGWLQYRKITLKLKFLTKQENEWVRTEDALQDICNYFREEKQSAQEQGDIAGFYTSINISGNNRKEQKTRVIPSQT